MFTETPTFSRRPPESLKAPATRFEPCTRQEIGQGLNGESRERVGLHDLRHSFVAVALASGLTVPEASTLARHANAKITAAAYAGLTDTGRAQLASKLEKAFAT